MLSNKMQHIILEIYETPLGIYTNEQTLYKHDRSFYRAVAYLDKHELLNRIKIPVMNKTRIILTAKGEMFGLLLKTIRDKDFNG